MPVPIIYALRTCWESLAFLPGLNAESHAIYVDGMEAESYIREQTDLRHVHLVEIPDDGQPHQVWIQARLDERVNSGDPASIQCTNAGDFDRNGLTGMSDFGLFGKRFGWRNDGAVVTERGGG
jgi:hypothetical protein